MMTFDEWWEDNKCDWQGFNSAAKTVAHKVWKYKDREASRLKASQLKEAKSNLKRLEDIVSGKAI